MKRRKFIKGVGMGTAAFAATPAMGSNQVPTGDTLPSFDYGGIESLEDAVSQEGYVVIRLSIEDNPDADGQKLTGI
jgi:hypothetical protein